MPRLFTAIELPETIRTALVHVQKSLHPDVKPTPCENLHLTLHFVGEVSEESATSLRSALATVSAPAFSLRVSGIGSFKAAGRRHVAWIGLEESPPLQHLYREIVNTLSLSALSGDSRTYTPHITIGRSRRGFKGRVFDGNPEFDETFDVSDFSLFRSELTQSGPIYSVVERYPLA